MCQYLQLAFGDRHQAKAARTGLDRGTAGEDLYVFGSTVSQSIMLICFFGSRETLSKPEKHSKGSSTIYWFASSTKPAAVTLDI